jgi:hypothetical protein
MMATVSGMEWCIAGMSAVSELAVRIAGSLRGLACKNKGYFE